MRLASALMLWIFVLCGCSPVPGDFGFVIEKVDSRWRNGQLMIRAQQQLSLSEEARKALVHGVPLTIDLQLVIRDPASGDNVKTHTDSFEVRYLPLSDHYQLTGPRPDAIRTYPRLRHVLAQLAAVEVSFVIDSPAQGEYELLARSRLNRRKVPAPMRLPVWFSTEWKHDSEWTTWTISAAEERLRS